MARRALGAATLAVVQAVERLAEGPWLVACSGGADSLALAWAAGYVGRRRESAVRAIVVDHGLQASSDAVAARVAARLASLPVPHAAPLVVPADVVGVQVAHDGSGPEASARAARYAALEASARPGERVLLGHTLDDQAETVLLGLARGSGIRSLSGMPAARGIFTRPLLGLGREVTAGACAELGLESWCDPHNDDSRYARVRVRAQVLPMLERELGPGVREALARTAEQLRRDADALDAEAAALSGDDEPDCRWLGGLAPALRDRVLRDWLTRRGARELTAQHVRSVAALVDDWHGQAGVHLPGLRVTREAGKLRGARP